MNSERSGDNDYYVILGVTPTASPEEITGAYYVLARKHHPDASSSDPGEASDFKRISEAYDVLSDEQKRRNYDRSRRTKVRRPQSAGSAAAFGFAPVGKQATTFPQTGGPAVPMANSAPVIEGELPIRPEEARRGGPCDFILTIRRECERCSGRGCVGELPCGTCHGKGQILRRQPVKLDLPPGLRTGTILRVAGQRQFHGTSGDLRLRIKILPYW